jgi:hypothetical protein
MDQNHLVSGKMIVIDTGQNRLTIFSHLNFSSDFLLLFLVNLTMKSINITTISYLQHLRLINVPMVFPHNHLTADEVVLVHLATFVLSNYLKYRNKILRYKNDYTINVTVL